VHSKHYNVFYGWWVVLTAAVGLFWGPPATVFSFSVFVRPIMHDFHAGRAAVSLVFTLGGITGAISALLAGRLVDRYGARRVILPATAMFGLLLLSIRLLSANLWQFCLFYTLSGLLMNCVGPVPYGSVVSHWFDRRRGLALGLMMFGIGSGAMIMPALAQQLIARFGWRAAYAILGAAVLLISMPVVTAFLKEKPQVLGLLPDGETSADCVVPPRLDALGLSWPDAWHSRTFWLMMCAFSLVGATVHGCLMHMAAMLTDVGISVERAALGSSLAGAAILIGRIGSGYLLDRFFAPRLAAMFFGGVAVGVGLLETAAPAAAFVAAFLVGLGLGAEVDIIAYLVSRYFGLRSFGEIYGAAFGTFVLAGALGPLAMGAGFDLTGSYKAPLAALFISTLVATVLITGLGPYRYHARQPDADEQLPRVQGGERQVGVITG
jgi:MFS family permease